MPFIFRITFAFDEPKQGWTESWYQQRDTNDCVTALDDMDLLAKARGRLCGSGALLTHYRASVVTDLGTGLHLTRLSQGRDVNYGGTTSVTPMPPHDALLVRCIPVDRTKKKDVFLSGCPRNVMGGLRQYEPPATFISLFDDWARLIRQNGMGWLHQRIDNDRQITNWSSDVLTGRTTYVLSGPITFAPNTDSRRVTVSIPGGHEALEGVQLVGPVPNGPNEVITTKPRPSHAWDGRLGRMRSYVYDFVSLFSQTGPPTGTRIDVQRTARRNRGRPLYAEAGRRAATVRF